jgi:hypothetical protein
MDLMSNGPQFFQTGYGQTFFGHQLPELIKGINRLATSIEEQNKLNTPNNEYVVRYKKDYRSSETKTIVFAKSHDEAKTAFLKENDYEVYEICGVDLTRLGG